MESEVSADVVHHDVAAIGDTGVASTTSRCAVLPLRTHTRPRTRRAQFRAVVARFGSDDIAIYDKVETGLVGKVAAADLEGEERLVNQ